MEPDGAPTASRMASHAVAVRTALLERMKVQAPRPAPLPDTGHLPLDAIELTPCGGVLIGAWATQRDTACHPLVCDAYPLLSSALMTGGLAQTRPLIRPLIRHMGSIGSSLFIRDAITPSCSAAQASDMCVALAVLDARIHLGSAQGARVMTMQDFCRLLGERPEWEATLSVCERITHIALPPLQQFQHYSSYLKLREHAAPAYAPVSVAAAMDLTADGEIREVRVALGGVAHQPCRNPVVEADLVGRSAGLQAFADLAHTLLASARGYGDRDFKIPLVHHTIIRALETAAAGVQG